MSVLRILASDGTNFAVDLAAHPGASVFVNQESEPDGSEESVLTIRAAYFSVSGDTHRFLTWNGPRLRLGETVSIAHLDATEAPPTPPDQTIEHDVKTICSFCGEEASDDRPLLKSAVVAAHICSECVEECRQVFRELGS